LVKTLYSGGIDGLQDIDAKLNLAAAEVKLVDENFVRHHGKLIQGSEDCQTSGD
jgi:hypothetical protein